MGYQKKHMGGFVPFWPTYPIGYFVRLFFRDAARLSRRESPSRYIVWNRQRPALLLKAISQMIGDELNNIWRSRLNQRVV